MTTHVHVVSHTHWDREWYLTFEQYRARLVDLVDGVLDRMSRDPRFAFFHLDGQSIVVEDYLEIRPEREAEIRARVAEGRLLIGPWYVMPDMFLVSGESLVRNLGLGLRVAERFGAAMRVGYMPDPFGHVAQMPQIVRGFGLEGAILWRGFGGRRAEYLWSAPDGSDVLLLHLPPDGYCNGLRLPMVPAPDLTAAASRVIEEERRRSSTDQVLLMVGVDHVEPHPALMDLVDALNDVPGVAARLSTLPAYVRGVSDAVRGTGQRLETVDGELRAGEDYAHLLPGVFSARLYLKQANAAVQRELERWAEPLAAFARLCGDPVPPGMLAYAWRTLLQNHPHDSICGCSIDDVHEENMTRFARAGQAAAAVSERAVRAIGSRVPPAPAHAIRSLVFNSSARAWSGVIEATVDVPIDPAATEHDLDLRALEPPLTFFGDGCDVTAVTDADGRALPFQVTAVEDAVAYALSRHAPPVAIRVRRTSLAIDVPEVPPLGYSTLDVHAGQSRHGPARAETGDRGIENDLLRIHPRPDGSVDVEDRRSGRRYEAVFAIEDTGDAGDEYNYSPPRADRRITGTGARRVRVTRAPGPLVSVLSIEYQLDLPAALDEARDGRSDDTVPVDVSMDVRVRRGSPVVECRGTVRNTARDHRMRMLCPTAAPATIRHRADSAFAILERPVDKPVPDGPAVETPVSTAPMQTFVDAGDSEAGATVVTDGLVEFEVLPRVPGSPIAVTLVRAVGDLSRNDLRTRRGHAGPGLATPGAQCAGRRSFRLAFVPRAAPPDAGALYATAGAVLAPPRVVAPCGGTGELPARHSFLPLDLEDGLILSALRVADHRDSLVLRVFNAAADTRGLWLRCRPEVLALWRVDLAERRIDRCADASGDARIDVPPGRIETLELALRPTEAAGA